MFVATSRVHVVLFCVEATERWQLMDAEAASGIIFPDPSSLIQTKYKEAALSTEDAPSVDGL